MNIEKFTEILKDKNLYDYKKMSCKYPDSFSDFLRNYLNLYTAELPIRDFDGNKIIFAPTGFSVSQGTTKLLLKNQASDYGIKSAEEEIIATSAIESIDFSRDSVRNILKGFAPANEQENRIYGIKQGLDFIADPKNKITEENLYRLYMMTVGNFLSEENRLAKGHYYRHEQVFVVSDKIEHSGLDRNKLPAYMKAFVEFINSEDELNDLVKASIIHFYTAYLHPYFDGNGRTARLLHLWFLVQRGYRSTLFIPFSSNIEKSRKKYYQSFSQTEENKRYCKRIDVTPFICYFNENVYNKIREDSIGTDVLELYRDCLKTGCVTPKEARLWQFVLSHYGTEEFSTKQLEKDFGDVAYATVRAFVLKFESSELLTSTKYGVRVKYRVRTI